MLGGRGMEQVREFETADGRRGRRRIPVLAPFEFFASSRLIRAQFHREGAKGPSGNKVYILLLAPRPAGKARATSIPAAVCKERATQPAGLRAAARRGAAAGGHLRCCRSSTMSPHRLRRGALHLPARRSRQNAHLISLRALIPRDTQTQR